MTVPLPVLEEKSFTELDSQKKVVPVDATGAGDQFAAGFLFGFATGQSLETCGRMGVIAAAEVIGHIGPRPNADLRKLFVSQGLI